MAGSAGRGAGGLRLHAAPLLAALGYLALRRALSHAMAPAISARDNPVPGCCAAVRARAPARGHAPAANI